MYEYWNGKNVLVTGCNGFLASWMVKVLVDAGANVIGVQRDSTPNSNLVRMGYDKRITIVNGKIEDLPTMMRALNEYDVDTCFHLAAQAIVGVANRSPLSTFESNIKGTWTVLEACRLSPTVKRVVVASSDKAYGSHDTLPYKEDFKLQGRHPYDASKSCTDILVQTYHTTYDMPTAILRCGNIYGGGDLNFSRIIPDSIRAIHHNRNPVIRSDGLFKRDYIHVLDVVDAYLTVGENLHRNDIKGEAFNFGTETPITVNDLVKMLLETSGKTNLVPEVLNQAKYEIREQYLSIDKARRLLNWNPKIDLKQGLQMCLEWYTKFLEDTKL